VNTPDQHHRAILQDIAQRAIRGRQFGNPLNSYDDDVIAALGDAQVIQILGPGEAKRELEKRLESKGHKGLVVSLETVDKMTDRQIAAKVRERFLLERKG
jgi:hypothetical protein